MFEMIVLALQTDSARVLTFLFGGLNSVPTLSGVSTGWHSLSHHGKDPNKLKELKRIELAQLTVFGEFMSRLASIEEGDETLLDHTCVLYGSNLGNASAHSWRNLPIVVAGGGLGHRGYVAHNDKNNTPLANLFVQLAQHVGVEIEQFGSSTAANINGLG